MQVRVKNTNFGPYKYDGTNATFTYQGLTVGQVSIPKAKAGLRSTKTVSVTVYVNSNGLPSTSSLPSDLSAGVLTLNSHAKLNGKVELLFVKKKKKSTQMNCTMNINILTKELQDLNCKWKKHKLLFCFSFFVFSFSLGLYMFVNIWPSRILWNGSRLIHRNKMRHDCNGNIRIELDVRMW